MPTFLFIQCFQAQCILLQIEGRKIILVITIANHIPVTNQFLKNHYTDILILNCNRNIKSINLKKQKDHDVLINDPVRKLEVDNVHFKLNKINKIINFKFTYFAATNRQMHCPRNPEALKAVRDRTGYQLREHTRSH